jgi:hypothetical protein
MFVGITVDVLPLCSLRELFNSSKLLLTAVFMH